MGVESKQWSPSRWKPGRLHRFMLHVHKTSLWACCQLLGEYEGNKCAAMLTAQYLEKKSVALLRAKQVPLIGDRQ